MYRTTSFAPETTVDHRVVESGVEKDNRIATTGILQQRLVSLIDLSLTLRHVHWNVLEPVFVGVHTMIDRQVGGVQSMIDRAAQRIAILGVTPNGLAGNLASTRSCDDYTVGRALVPEHLVALNGVFADVIRGHRKAIDVVGRLDRKSLDLLIEQTAALETYQWFVRAHIESGVGEPFSNAH